MFFGSSDFMINRWVESTIGDTILKAGARFLMAVIYSGVVFGTVFILMGLMDIDLGNAYWVLLLLGVTLPTYASRMGMYDIQQAIGTDITPWERRAQDRAETKERWSARGF